MTQTVTQNPTMTQNRRRVTQKFLKASGGPNDAMTRAKICVIVCVIANRLSQQGLIDNDANDAHSTCIRERKKGRGEGKKALFSRGIAQAEVARRESECT